jgi:hypothetical protein
MRLHWQQWMQMDEGSDKVKWTSDEWHSHDTRRPKKFIVVDVPQSIANGRVQNLTNNVEDVVISAGSARSEAWNVNNQE